MIDSMKTVTIILPAYNEESSFELLKERMGEVLKQNPDLQGLSLSTK